MSSVRAAWLITSKELRVQVRRRSLFVLGFVAPFALAFVMNIVFGGIDEPDGSITFDVGLVVLDEGDAADGFAATIDSIAESGLLDVTRLDTEEAARAAVDDGDVAAAWVVPDGFSEGVGSPDGTATITVIAEVDSPTTASVARSIAQSFAVRTGTGRMAAIVGVSTGAVPATEADALAEEVASAVPLLTTADVESTATILDTTTLLMAGMALFFAFFTAGMPLLGIVEERDQSTLDRLLVAPIPAGSVLAGKTVAALILGTISLVALVAASSVIMGADWGPLVAAIPLGVAAIVAVAGIMSIAGSLARTAEAAGNVQAIVAVVLAILGGAFVPIPASSDGLLATLQELTPHGWFFEGLGAIQAGDAAAALPAIGVLLAMGAVTLAIGTSLARRVIRR